MYQAIIPASGMVSAVGVQGPRLGRLQEVAVKATNTELADPRFGFASGTLINLAVAWAEQGAKALAAGDRIASSAAATNLAGVSEELVAALELEARLAACRSKAEAAAAYAVYAGVF